MLNFIYMQNVVQPKFKVTKKLITVKGNVVICIVLSLKSDKSKNGITTQLPSLMNLGMYHHTVTTIFRV